jgi:hypothetical protein
MEEYEEDVKDKKKIDLERRRRAVERAGGG